MPFSTPLFVWAFLPLVLLLYFSLRQELRNPLLLFVSLVFYAWGETFMVVILIVSCIANWGFGRWIEASSDAGGRKRALVVGIVFNIGLLLAFKYSTWLWTDIFGQPLASLGALFDGSPGLKSLLLDKAGNIHLPI